MCAEAEAQATQAKEAFRPLCAEAKQYLESIGLGHLDAEEPEYHGDPGQVRLAGDITLEVQPPTTDVDGCVWLCRGIDGYSGNTPEEAEMYLEQMLEAAEAEVSLLRRALISLQGEG